ncbi:MAG: cytochrome c biogenesis protein CcsA [Deltaproteobacteria bacterium]|nr:cytochrome c biogenesis protein CcsA [Deltaproteobacteria bacterium]
MANLGYIVLLVAFFFGTYTVFLAANAGFGRKEQLYVAARYGVFAVAGLMSAAAFALLYAFATHDFTIRYVWQHSDSTMPMFYNMLALWGGQEGSLLFWAWILSLFSAVVVVQNKNRHRDLMPHVIWILQAIVLFFTVLMVFSANPFHPFAEFDSAAALDLPLRGRGLNPQLQTPVMAIHPPMLYFGYIGWTIPFAFGIAALITRRSDAEWTKTTRRWALVAWIFLTVGNLLGSYWAYTELGWGGFWAWDPVENAALIPWFTGTAYLHSIQIQERRGILKIWNVVLVTLSFVLTVFGTFLTRSGFVNSVHSFAKSDIGFYFLFFLAVVLLGAFGLIIARRDVLKAEARIDSLVSREFVYLLNNILLLGSALAVLAGTIWPPLSELILNSPITIAEPWFNRVMAPIGILLLFLAGAGPLFPWRRASKGFFMKQVLWPTIAALVMAGATVALWTTLFPLSPVVACATDAVCGPGRHCADGTCVRDTSIAAVLAVACVVFLVVTVLQEYARGTRLRMKNTGARVASAVGGLVARAPRRFGGYIVHVGFAFLFIAFAGQCFKQEFTATMKAGETVSFAGHSIRLDRVETYTDTHKRGAIAHISLFDGNELVATLAPEDRVYNSQDNPKSTEVDIHSTLWRDLYFILRGVGGPAAAPTIADIKVYYNPMMLFLWLGGVVMVLGTIVSIMPVMTRATVPVRRKSLAPVPTVAIIIVVAILSLIGIGVASARAEEPRERERVVQAAETRDPRAQRVDDALMCPCPDCNFSKILARCGCGKAEMHRERIGKLVAAGKSPDEIIAMYLKEFGGRVLAVPVATAANTMVRVLPYVAIGLALLLVVGLARVWIKRSAKEARGDGRRVEPGPGALPATTPPFDERFERDLKRIDR